MLRYSTAGESHGKGLVGIIEGLPAGLVISEEYINRDLSRRQKGYGRGGRMKIEQDQVEILSGVRNRITLGSPVSFFIKNRDFKNWQEIMSPGDCSQAEEKIVRRPRPGHADLAGAVKYQHQDMRNVLERSSARETAARVAAGAFFKQLLAAFNIYIYSEVVAIGEKNYSGSILNKDLFNDETIKAIESSDLHCADSNIAEEMIKAIDQAKRGKESLGGSFLVMAKGIPPGLGTYTRADLRLDTKIAAAFMSIPAIKAVEIGDAINISSISGSKAHDEIHYTNDRGIYRESNRMGGIEGGVSNGEDVWVKAYMKPLPTLMKPLISVNTETWQEERADIERTDVCAVPAAAIVGEAEMAYVLAAAFLEKFGADSMSELEVYYSCFRTYIEKVWKWKKT